MLNKLSQQSLVFRLAMGVGLLGAVTYSIFGGWTGWTFIAGAIVGAAALYQLNKWFPLKAGD